MDPDTLIILGICALVGAPIVIGLTRANEIVVLDAKGGKLAVRLGRAPQKLLSELGEVARRAKLDGVALKIVVEDGRPRLVAEGPIDDGVAQRLRNVVGLFTLAELRQRPKA